MIEYKLSGVPEFKRQSWEGLQDKATTLLSDLLEEASSSPAPDAMLGWLSLPQGEVVEACKKYQDENLDFFYDSIFVCGTGGSQLGCRMLEEVLPFCQYMQGKEALATMPIYYVGQHVSAYEFSKTQATLKSSQPLLVFISKSGTTFETSVSANFLIDSMKEKYPDNYQRRIVAISSGGLEQKPGFDELLKQPVLDLPKDVGGRFSVFSSVGMAPLCFAGFELHELVEGARQCLEDADEVGQQAGLQASGLCLFAADRAGLGKEQHLEAFMYGEPALEPLALWWQQLFAESEGKDQKGALPVPVQWSRDLHSVGQWLQQGPKVYWQTFLQSKTNGKFSGMENMRSIHASNSDPQASFDIKDIKFSLGKAVRKAHLDSGNQQLHLWLDEWSPKNLGYFMQWSMLACVVTCKLQGVNPFDQPGVEAYKKQFLNGLV